MANQMQIFSIRNRCKAMLFAGVFYFFLFGTAVQGEFVLSSPEQSAVVVVAASEPEFVRLAAEDLVSDVKKITGRVLSLVENIPQQGRVDA